LVNLGARRDLEQRVVELEAEVEREKRAARGFRAAAAAAMDGFFACDGEGRFLEVDDGCCALLGWAREELLSKSLAAVGPAALSEELLRASAGARARLKARLGTRDGRPLEVELSAIRSEEGLLLGFVRSAPIDEGQPQAQKMEAVARLAGGVAHAFNNLLTAITGYSELLLESFVPGDPRRDDLLEVHRAGDRAVTLTRQLLAFGRKQVLRSRNLDLNAVVRNLEKQLRRLIGEDRALRMDLAPGLPAVWADPRQIEQVIICLAVNARDAMPGGGRLTLTTRALPPPEPGLSRAAGAAEPRGCVELAVEDTGTGMEPETLSHLFEPFFTTKEEKGKGTGLGLAASYGIVAQSGGHIVVESEPGKGSTFRVRLPAAEPGRRP
jgi:PAS domain S-box-containing protein